MDDYTIIDHTGALDLPDGLAHFRMNLMELLVDICQLLRSATFIQKVLIIVRFNAYASIKYLNC